MKNLITIIITFLAITTHALAAPVAEPKINPDGTVNASAFTSFSACKANPISAGRTIVVKSVMPVNTLTVPDTQSVIIVKSGQLSVASGKTLTINGHYTGYSGSIAGSGAVVFNGMPATNNGQIIKGNTFTYGTGQAILQAWENDSGETRMQFGDTGIATRNTDPALKIMGTRGLLDTVELALVQNESGLRTYGGYFLVDATSSDFSWNSRTNLVDKKRLIIKNSDGAVGFNVDNPKLVNGTSFGSVMMSLRNRNATGTYFAISDGSGTSGIILNDELGAANHRLWSIDTDTSDQSMAISRMDDSATKTKKIILKDNGSIELNALTVFNSNIKNNLNSYADNAAAVAAGLTAGYQYISSGGNAAYPRGITMTVY